MRSLAANTQRRKPLKPYLWLLHGQVSGIITEDEVSIFLSRNGSYVIGRISRDGAEGISDGQSQRHVSFQITTDATGGSGLKLPLLET